MPLYGRAVGKPIEFSAGIGVYHGERELRRLVVGLLVRRAQAALELEAAQRGELAEVALLLIAKRRVANVFGRRLEHRLQPEDVADLSRFLRALPAVGLISFFAFPVVSSKAFSAFSCEGFDEGRAFLRADYSVQCSTDAYHSDAHEGVVILKVNRRELEGQTIIRAFRTPSHSCTLHGREGGRGARKCE